VLEDAWKFVNEGCSPWYPVVQNKLVYSFPVLASACVCSRLQWWRPIAAATWTAESFDGSGGGILAKEKKKTVGRLC